MVLRITAPATMATVLVALLATACGVNNPGDPVAPTRDLVGPAPPDSHADVYCVPITAVDVEPVTQDCDVLLRTGSRATDQEAVDWWFQAADALRPRIGKPFPYQDQLFIYRSVSLDRRTADGDWASVGWRCPQDASRSQREVVDAMAAREPLAAYGFRSEQAGRTAGCRIARPPIPAEAPPSPRSET